MKKFYLPILLSFAFIGNIHGQFADVRLYVEVRYIYIDYCSIETNPNYTSIPYIRLNEEEFKGPCITKDGAKVNDLNDDGPEYNEYGNLKTEKFGTGSVVFDGTSNAQFLEHRLRSWENDVGDRCGYGSNFIDEDDCYWDSGYAKFNFRSAYYAPSLGEMGFRTNDYFTSPTCDGLDGIYWTACDPYIDIYNIDPEDNWEHAYQFSYKWNYVRTQDAPIVDVPFCGKEITLQYPSQQINARQVNLRKGIPYSIEILSKNDDIISVSIYNENRKRVHTIFGSDYYYNDRSRPEDFQVEEDGMYFIEAARMNDNIDLWDENKHQYPREDVNLELKEIPKYIITEIPSAITLQTDPEICGKIVNYSPVRTDSYCNPIIKQISGLPSGSRFPVGTTTNTFQLHIGGVVEDTKSFDVVVTTTEILSLETKDVHTNLPEGGVLVLSHEQVLSGSIDICNLKSFALSKETFTCNDAGSHTVTVTAIDYYDNVFLSDIEVFIETKTIVKTLDLKYLNLNFYGDQIALSPSAIDAGSFSPCYENSELEFSLSKTYFNCEDVGKDITVTFSIKEPNGTITTGTTKIIVNDGRFPVVEVRNISLNLNENGEVSLTADQLDAGSWDNCGIASYSLSKYNFNVDDLGANNVIFSVTDVNGLIDSKLAIVTVVPFSELNTRDLVIGIGEDGTAKIEPEDVYLSAPNLGTILTYRFDDTDKTNFNCTDVGKEFTVQLTVEDAEGKTATNFAFVKVEDGAPPILGANPLTVELNLEGRASITVNDITDGSRDNCGPVELSLSKYNFTIEDIGDNIIVLSGRDINGLTSEKEVVVTVKDYQGPIIVTKDPIVLLGKDGKVDITIHDVYSHFIYNSPLRLLGVDKKSFGCGDMGENTVSITLTFSDGAVATTTATVTVKDQRAPIITCDFIPLPYVATSAQGLVVHYNLPLASDNCEVSEINLTTGLPSGAVFPIGTTLVGYEAIDTSGNVSSCSFEVKVQNDVSTSFIHPALIEVDNAIGQCGAYVNLNDYVEAKDDLPLMFEPASGSFFPLGMTEVIATANYKPYIFYVEVTDAEEPELVFNDNVWVLEPIDDRLCSGYVRHTNFDAILKGDNCKNVTVTNNINQTSTLKNERFYARDNTIIWTLTTAEGKVKTYENIIHFYGAYPPVWGNNNYKNSEFVVSADEGRCNYTVKDINLDPMLYTCELEERITLINSYNGTSTLDGEQFGIGTTEITWTVTYNVNKTLTQIYRITVNGNVEPKLSDRYLAILDASKCTYQVQGAEFDATFDANCFAGVISNNYNSTATLANEQFDVGTHKVIWTVENEGNTIDYESLIEVSAPDLQLNCPENILISATSSFGAIVDYLPPTVSNSCSATISLIEGPKSSSEFPIGVTLIEYAVEDVFGNSKSCSFTVTVSDDGPIITCPGAIAQNVVVQLDSNGIGSTTAELVNNGNNDPCGIATLELSKTDFTCSDIGQTNEVTLTVTDNNGNVSTATANVEVQDKVMPNAIAQNVVVQLDASGIGSTTAELVNNGSNDACGIASLELSKTQFSCADIGQTNEVILTVTDNNGKVSTATANVVVEDNVLPNAIAQNVAVQLDANGIGSTTAELVNNGSNDACGIASLNLSKTEFTCADISQINEVILTVTDNNGNVSTATANVVVEDNVFPNAIAQNVVVQLDASGNGSTTAELVNNGSNDDCGIASLELSKTEFRCADIGQINEVTLTVTDNNGKVSTATANVEVQDNVLPTAIAQNVTVQLDASGNGSTTAELVNNGSNDACGIASLELSKIEFRCADIGQINEVTLTVTDNNGNVSTATANVVVEDNVLPNAIAQNVVVELDANGNGSTTAELVNNGSNDACGIASLELSKTEFTCKDIGQTNEVILTVTENNGNISTATANVEVRDKVMPNAIAQNVVVKLDATGKGSTTAALVNNGSNDNCGIASLELSKTDFTCSDIGQTNEVTLTVTDNNGNVSTATANVVVRDNINPVITCNQDDFRYLDPYQTTYTIQGIEFDATATDGCNIASLQFEESITGLKGSSMADVQLGLGDHTINWTSIDVNKNSASCSNIITINKRSTTITYTGGLNEQYSDQVELSATLTDDVLGIGIKNQMVTFTLGSQSTTTVTNDNGVANTSIFITQDPSQDYTVKVTYSETATYTGSSDSKVFDVLQEDASVEYTGQALQATNSSRDSQATIMLTANIQDITANMDYDLYDSYAGDINNAMVKFVQRDGTFDSGWLPISELINPLTGTVNYSWTVDIGNAASESFTIGIIVDNGYYLKNSSEDDTVITVYMPVGDFITGGGHIVPSNSYGEMASTPGLKTNFGFNVKYNNKGTKLKGHMNIIFRRLENDGIVHVYQIKGNAMQSLGVDTSDETAQFATFKTKSNLTDITNPNNPLSLGGNLILTVKMTDRGEPGTDDSISITLDDNGRLVYASHWTGIKNEEMQLSKGNLLVHSGFSLKSSSTTEVKTATISNEEDVAVQVLDFKVAPNPSDSFFTVRVVSENQKDRVRLVVHSYTGSILYETSGKATDEIAFGERFAAGTYIVKVYQAGQTVEKVVIKM